MLALVIKAVIGALLVVLISVVAGTKNYYIAGLVPLFPTFTLVAHYVVGTQRTVPELKATIRFGLVACIPYFIYMGALYFLVDRVKLPLALLGATGAWIVAATVLLLLWK